ncbi:cellulose synthase subunit BcsC [Legionella massiliensis]|uniref:Cellulose synthase subunit BcsC n=1 Tax=Legionella massiliensis TaxID=1034943 RepID=A0A078KZ60_9GAMM|nr:tetratricopeptide repeat protein [Legionella massiliensis]CDZ77049.1 cellulose synthase subunit BcsC [Legionella massiliensis]CEE12787.1 cellulose synthase subunit BcsC [Legionella massiliensis]
MDISNDSKEKLTQYLHFLEQDPNNFNLLLSVSDSYRQLGDFASAQLYLDKAKKIDSEGCFAQQGIIDLNLGHFEEAKDALHKALLKEDLPILRYGLAVCYYSLQEINKGIEVLSPLLAHGSSTYEVELLMAKLLHQSNRLDEAVKSLETTIENHGQSGEALALLAQLYFDGNEVELADDAAKQALVISPNNYEAQILRILLHLTDGDATLEQINKLLAKETKDARLWFALGTIHLRELSLHSAEEAFLKAAELEPLFCDNWISLGWCQLFLDKLSEAENSYKQAIQIYEESPESWGGLALVYALRGEIQKATTMIKKAKDLDSHCFLADIARIIVSQHSDPDEAGKQFNQTFPAVADKINAAMAIVLAEMDNRSSTLH